jgi:divinyl protochlorophyllide a 8-vinyl-reductase
MCSATVHKADVSGRIGPNAVLQLMEALQRADLGDLIPSLFGVSGASSWLDEPPTAMVDQQKVAALHQAVRTHLPPSTSQSVLREAGRLTADYLLAVRIPRLAQRLLRVLPDFLAARLLLAAISANAWTFAGTGAFTTHQRTLFGGPIILELQGNPLCAGEIAGSPCCAWHEAVFARLFQVLVNPACTVVELECEAQGAACCRFLLDLHS